MDEKEKKETWRGVKWIPPVNGICPKHDIEVTPITRICPSCHQEQLAASRAGSREWENPSLKKVARKDQDPGPKHRVLDDEWLERVERDD